MLLNKLAALAALTIALSACGGSGGGPSSSSGDITEVVGIYDTSRTENETNYTYIDSNGTVIVFDYQGDATGGDNCYEFGDDTGGINAELHGGTVSEDNDYDGYRLTSGNYVIQFKYDDSLGMNDFEADLDGTVIIGTTILTFSFAGIDITIGGSQTTTVQLEDLTESICD